MRWLDRLICRLTGHRGALLHFEDARLSLKCHDCGYQSQGWQLALRREKKRPKVVRLARRRRLVT